MGSVSCSMSSAAAAVASESSFSTQSLSTNEPVVHVQWVHENLRKTECEGSGYCFVLDASWYMPHEQRDPILEHQFAHIPGAFFFDLDGISDQTTNLPHMLPSEEAFSAAISALGIENKDFIIVYDGKGIFSAARVWWMFRVFGHDKIWVMDGGLPSWQASGFDVESGDVISKASEAVERVYQGEHVGPITFQTHFQPHLVWKLEQVQKNIQEQTHQHLDARPKARFDGIAPEPRKGIKNGHIPRTKCIPFPEMLDCSQTLLPSAELKNRFEHEGISIDRHVITSCGTGVTTCILALAFHRLRKTDIRVYDASWTKWTTNPDLPVVSSQV